MGDSTRRAGSELTLRNSILPDLQNLSTFAVMPVASNALIPLHMRQEQKDISESLSSAHRGKRDPELHNGPQHCHNGEQQKHDSPPDDTGHIQPVSLAVSLRFRRGLSQQHRVSRVASKPNRKQIAENRNRT